MRYNRTKVTELSELKIFETVVPNMIEEVFDSEEKTLLRTIFA